MTAVSGASLADLPLAPAPAGLPRLLPSPVATAWPDHVARLGRLRTRRSILGSALVSEVERAALRGRGGAGFPTAVKLAAVRSSRAARAARQPVVVANGTEGEPASAKDAVLLWYAPHLVLDGMVAAASAVGADEAVMCVDRASTRVIEGLQRALAERQAEGTDPIALSLVATPSRYVAGEETALVHWLNGGDAKPTFVPPRPFERGVDARPTLVDNVETLAGLALIARFGAEWWRRVGTADDPGSLLVTLGGAFGRTGVREVAFGTSLGDVMQRAGVEPHRGVLLGGYFGTWVDPGTARSLRLTTADLHAVGGGFGCGAIFALPASACPLAETARVAALARRGIGGPVWSVRVRPTRDRPRARGDGRG